MSLFLSNLYIIVIALSVGCSLFGFPLHYPRHLKILSVLLVLALIVEFTAVNGLKLMGLSNNMIIYNPFMLIEFCFYAIIFQMITRFNWLKKLINWYLILFVLLWLISVIFIFGITAWISYVSVVGSAFTIFFAVTYYYQILTENEARSLKRNPEFWISTGLIIFYAGNLPYTSMLNYLVKYHEDIASQLAYVLKLLNIVMYSLFAYAYLCHPKTNLVSST